MAQTRTPSLVASAAPVIYVIIVLSKDHTASLLLIEIVLPRGNRTGLYYLSYSEFAGRREREHAEVHARRVPHEILANVPSGIGQKVGTLSTVDRADATTVKLNEPVTTFRSLKALLTGRRHRGLHETSKVKVHVLIDVRRRSLAGGSGLGMDACKQRRRFEQFGALFRCLVCRNAFITLKC